MSAKLNLTQEYFKSVLHYDPETGVFIWLVNPPRGPRTKGKRAGGIKIGKRNKNYMFREIQIGGRAFIYKRTSACLVVYDW